MCRALLSKFGATCFSSKCYHHRRVKPVIASRAFAGVNPKDLALFQIPPTMQQAPLSNSMLPKTNSMLSFWRAQPHHLDAERTTEELPKECDVLIIGAGYAGVSTAYHLQNNGSFAQSIMILEAREACSGATGRNGKFPIGLTVSRVSNTDVPL